MKELLTGNEAIAQAAYDAGVQFASAYPGTPSTEILENISAHKDIYAKTLSRLQKSGDAPFTLGADAVLKVLIQAIEAKKPKIRYGVTFPTKLFAVLKRIFPTWLMDTIARKASE